MFDVLQHEYSCRKFRIFVNLALLLRLRKIQDPEISLFSTFYLSHCLSQSHSGQITFFKAELTHSLLKTGCNNVVLPHNIAVSYSCFQ